MTKKKNKIEILIEQTTDKNGCYLFKNILTFAPGGPSSPELPLGPGLP